MKKKLNLVGNTFTHLTNGNKGYSVHGKESKYIEWVKNGSDITFYIDDTINNGIQDNSCLLYTSPSPRDLSTSRMPSSA